jgi:regulator of protease activity HflC (stomatin/prohibitin superfamily)
VSILLIQAAGFGLVVVAFVVLLFVIFLVASAVRIVNEYERGVIFRLGRVQGTAKGPGLFFLIPIVDKMIKIDLRTITMDVPPQDLITRDNVPARVNAVVYFRVIDPNKSVIEVENHVLATSQISQTTLRSVLGQKDLDDLLTDRESINEELQTIIDQQTDPWGVKVSVVEVKDVEIPQGMQRSMAGQAQAERERRAKIISAEGEYQASQRLHDAAERLESPTALQLRLFQTLTEIASENNSTVILPVPIDLFRPYLSGSNGSGEGHAQQARAVRRREEEEAERLYEEAVGEVRSEQRAVQELGLDGTNPPVGPAPGEEAATPVEAPRKAVPPDAPRTEEPPPRTGDAPPSPSEQPPR